MHSESGGLAPAKCNHSRFTAQMSKQKVTANLCHTCCATWLLCTGLLCIGLLCIGLLCIGLLSIGTGFGAIFDHCRLDSLQTCNYVCTLLLVILHILVKCQTHPVPRKVKACMATSKSPTSSEMAFMPFCPSFCSQNSASGTRFAIPCTMLDMFLLPWQLA